MMNEVEIKNTKKKQTEWCHSDFPLLSKEEAMEMKDKFDINVSLIAFGMKEPFFADIIRALHKHETYAVDTAGVNATVDRINLYYNPLFMAPYEHAEVMAIFCHEVLHISLGHVLERKFDPHLVWNWACDLAINSSIPNMPPLALVAGKKPRGVHPVYAEKKELTEQDIKEIIAFQTLLSTFPSNLSAEEYYVLLMESNYVKKLLEQAELFKKMAGMFEFDQHEGWGAIPDEHKEYVREKIRNIVGEAIQRADGSNKWGSVSQSMREELRKFVSRTIPWQEVLRLFVGFTHRAETRSAMNRLSRKYPGLQAGTDHNRQARINVYIDQSGSMSDDDIALAFSELKGLAERVEINVYHFDTQVDVTSKMRWRRGNASPKCLRTRSGGTDFDAPTIHAKENKPEGYIIITDGGAPKPDSSLIRRCFILVPGQTLAFEPDSKDIVVKMTKPKPTVKSE